MAITGTPEAFRLKFSEAIDYLKAKLPEGTHAWDDLAGPVHAKVFAVAGATKVDLVQDLHNAITRAIEQGYSIGDFRKDFDKTVQAHGWSYKGKRGWRTRVIYDANMRSAHMAGRWAQLQANKERKPYLQYLTAGDSRVRPQHRQWDGLVYPIDHPFWDTHYPPNGWGCRCTIRPRSADDVQEMGLSVQEHSPKMTSRMIANNDGEITDIVPNGIDAGWDHNVGKSWIAPEVALGQKLARLPIWLRGQMSKKAVSPAFLQVIQDNFVAFQARLKQDVVLKTAAAADGGISTRSVPVARGNVQVLGYLDNHTLDKLQEQLPALNIESTVLLHLDKNQNHIEGLHKTATMYRDGSQTQVWPEIFRNRLPTFLSDYRAVLWDVDSQALLFVPKEQFNQSIPTAAFKQRKTKLGMAWELKGLGSKDMASLRDAKKYLPVAGSLR